MLKAIKENFLIFFRIGQLHKLLSADTRDPYICEEVDLETVSSPRKVES